MTMARQLKTAGLAAIAAVFLTTLSVNAGPKDRYAVVTIVNQTPYRVDYSYVWGGNGRGKLNNHIPPNSEYSHWWTFRYQGQDYAPWFYVQLEEDFSHYKLRSFYSPNTDGKNGRVYYIRFENNKMVLRGKLYR